MELIKSIKSWNKYKSIQEGRVNGYEFKHVNPPETFPCLVETSLSHLGTSFNIVHHIVGIKEAKQLIKAQKSYS